MILDVACGPGVISNYLQKKNQQYVFTLVDGAPNMIELARKNVLKASFHVMDCRNLLSLNKKYDGICSGFFMPYISREECSEHIRQCYNLLNTNGVFYFSFIEGDPANSGFKVNSAGNEYYLFYHERKSIEKYLSDLKFEITYVEESEFKYKDGTVLKTPIYIVIKKF